MKVSKMIENLEYMKTTYGDLEIILQIEDNEDEDVLQDNSIYFTTDEKVIYIQNFEF